MKSRDAMTPREEIMVMGAEALAAQPDPLYAAATDPQGRAMTPEQLAAIRERDAVAYIHAASDKMPLTEWQAHADRHALLRALGEAHGLLREIRARWNPYSERALVDRIDAVLGRTE